MLRVETLTIKEQKEPLLRETARVDIEERETTKIAIFLRILTKIKEKKAKIPSFTLDFCSLVLVYVFLGFVLVFSAFFLFVAMDSLSILGFYVVLNISMSN